MRVQEAIAAGFVRFGHVRSEQNIADIMTKPDGIQLLLQYVRIY
jgi:hypothetical protein